LYTPNNIVRLFNKGISIIEVSDDGIGVPIDSRKFLATPHATSKIRSFEDIYHCPDDSSDEEDWDDNNDDGDSTNDKKQNQNVDIEDEDDVPSAALATMGFRGEALFCLANLSGNLMVSTRTASEEMAEQMEFRKDGSLNTTVGISNVARKVGTSVAIVSLFESIPVRRKDMIRRIKTQRSKLLDLMEGYAIFSTGTQMHLMDMSEQNNDYTTKTLLQTTKNNRTITETVSSILGPKFLQSTSTISIDLTDIVSISKDPGTSSSTSNPGNVTRKRKVKYQLHGLISNAANVSSRTSSISMKGVRHAQFFAINRRPVDLPKIVRLINETWRSLVGSFANGNNSATTSTTISQSPSFVLQFTIPNNSYDINLSPDKRQVIFTNEIEIHNAIRDGIVQLWRSQTEGVFKIQNNDLSIGIPRNCSIVTGTSSSSSDGSRRSSFGKVDLLCEGRDNLDEYHNIDSDAKQVQLLFDDRLTTGSDDNADWTFDEINKNDANDTANTPSRRYGFTDDPTLASSRESEDRKLRKEFVFSPQKEQNEPNNVGSVADQDAEREHTVVKVETKKVNLTSTSSRQVISPSPTQFGLTRSTLTLPEACHDYAGFEDTPMQSHSYKDADDDCNQSRERSQDDILTRTEQNKWIEVSNAFNRGGDDAVDSVQRLFDRTARKPDIENKLQLKDEFEKSNQTTKYTPIYPQPVGHTSATPTSDDNIRTTNTGTRFDMFRLEQFGFKTYKKKDDTSLVVSDRSLSNSRKTEQNDKDHDRLPLRLKGKFTTENATNDNTLLSEQNSTPCLTNQNSSQRPPGIDVQSGVESTTPKSTVWKSFADTDDVVAAAIQARIAIVDRKSKRRNLSTILDLQQNVHNSTTDSSETCSSAESDVIQAPENSLATINLKKDDFNNMKIVGQFNLGFILATTDDGNLWILDQHACDEKYNFERLCKETVIHEQRLIAPMALEMSSWEETCILDNMDIFETNGFRFSFDPDKPVRHRLSLTALPHSGARDGRKSVQFGKEDVGALCEILGSSTDTEYSSSFGGGTGVDGSGMFSNNAIKRHAARVLSDDNSDKIIARLPKAIAMFASRACRGSIMIGKALSSGEMDKVVKRLADIEHPWNCPHGRPTMRHVVDLNPVIDTDEKSANEYVAEPTTTICTQYEDYKDCAGIFEMDEMK
jgi:DNA mismatch repair protein PMS2